MASQRRPANPLVRGFTLVELLVVIGIILAVSVLALPTVLNALRDQQISEASRILHAAIYAVRDAAQVTNSPRGIRFLPDPAFPLARLASGQLNPAVALASDRWVRTEVPSDYAFGLASVWPGTDYSGVTSLPCLVLEEQPGHWELSGSDYSWVINEPTNWWNTIRLGERLRLKSQWYTVCGPMAAFNPEMLANAPRPLTRTYTAPNGKQQIANPQYLLLVNSKDDNQDGFVDSGWDGLDNNGDGSIDELAEWETEVWPPSLIGNLQGLAYTIARRPVPSPNQEITALPDSIVIDLTTWQTTGERSHLPVNPYTGAVDLVIESNGAVRPDLPYGVRSSQGMLSSFDHFWLTDRRAVVDPVITTGSFLTLPIPPALSGPRYLVQVQARTGLTTTGPLESFANPAIPRPTDPLMPFLEYRQGR